MYRLLIRFLFMLVISLKISGCSDNASVIKASILNALDESDNKSVIVDLSGILGAQVMKVCVQTPYLTKSFFEQEMDVRARNFDEVGDESFVLWLFFDGGDPLSVQFNRWTELNYSKDSAAKCSDSPVIVLTNGQLTLDRT